MPNHQTNLEDSWLMSNIGTSEVGIVLHKQFLGKGMNKEQQKPTFRVQGLLSLTGPSEPKINTGNHAKLFYKVGGSCIQMFLSY